MPVNGALLQMHWNPRLWQMWEYSLKRREITLKKSNSCGRLSIYLLTSEVKLSTLKLCLRFTVWIEEYKNLTDPELERTSEPLLAKQKKQQGPLTTLYTSKDEAAKSSFVISQIHKNNYNSFSDGEIVKECLMDSAALIRPEKKTHLEYAPLQVNHNKMDQGQFGKVGASVEY